MDNQEKLKTAKTITILLNRTGEPRESLNRTRERLIAGELTPEEIQRLEEACKRLGELGENIKADEKNFLQTHQFPPDVVQAVRVAMADLFGEFVTAEEIGDYSMDKIWELLQTDFDRRQWLTKINKTPPSATSWTPQTEMDGRRILKASPAMKSNDFVETIGGNRGIAQSLYRHITGKPKRKTSRN